MNRKGGTLATCDAEACTNTLQVDRGEDPEWTMDWAGWEIRSDWHTRLADPDVLILCPQHGKWA